MRRRSIFGSAAAFAMVRGTSTGVKPPKSHPSQQHQSRRSYAPRNPCRSLTAENRADRLTSCPGNARSQMKDVRRNARKLVVDSGKCARAVVKPRRRPTSPPGPHPAGRGTPTRRAQWRFTPGRALSKRKWNRCDANRVQRGMMTLRGTTKNERQTLERRCAAGELHRVHPNTYMPDDVWAGLDQAERRRIHHLTAVDGRRDMVIVGRSAALVHGLEILDVAPAGRPAAMEMPAPCRTPVPCHAGRSCPAKTSSSSSCSCVCSRAMGSSSARRACPVRGFFSWSRCTASTSSAGATAIGRTVDVRVAPRDRNDARGVGGAAREVSADRVGRRCAWWRMPWSGSRRRWRAA